MVDLDGADDTTDATLEEENARLKDELEKIKKAQAGSDKKVQELQKELQSVSVTENAAERRFSIREEALREREDLLAKREVELDKVEALKAAGVPTELKDVIAGSEPSEYIEKAKLLKDIIESEVAHGITAEIVDNSVVPKSGETSKRRRLDTLTRTDAERMSDREWAKLMREASQ